MSPPRISWKILFIGLLVSMACWGCGTPSAPEVKRQDVNESLAERAFRLLESDAFGYQPRLKLSSMKLCRDGQSRLPDRLSSDSVLAEFPDLTEDLILRVNQYAFETTPNNWSESFVNVVNLSLGDEPASTLYLSDPIVLQKDEEDEVYFLYTRQGQSTGASGLVRLAARETGRPAACFVLLTSSTIPAKNE